jgi:hypothetical protein
MPEDPREVVIFYEPGADEGIERFRKWCGDRGAALDLGVGADSRHRYLVSSGLWSQYVRKQTGRGR